LIKLADLHEEFLDAGHLYQPRKKLLWDEDTNRYWLQDVAKRIESLGYQSWAQEFRLAVDSNKGNIPDAIRGKASSSYILAPGMLFDSHLKNRLIRWLSPLSDIAAYALRSGRRYHRPKGPSLPSRVKDM
jgi:hypothetical protein